ncbi:MAG: YdeI/OmpD-associated family protein, partial [Sphingomonas sp.]
FAAALSKAPEAKEVLEAFPPSAQRDYFEWIGEAKQDATREKRIATAIEWLSEGKRRHWKYQSC